MKQDILKQFKFWGYEPSKGDRLVGRTLQQDQRSSANLSLMVDAYYQIRNVGSIQHSFFLKRLKRLKKHLKKGNIVITIKIRWLWAIFILLFALQPQSHHVIYADPIAPVTVIAMEPVKILKPTTTNLVEQQELQEISQYPQGSCTTGIVTGNFYEDFIIQHESGGSTCAANASGAYGLCQSLPGNKMASAGADWATNPTTQLAWCNSYAIARYGGWPQAYSYWVAHSNW